MKNRIIPFTLTLIVVVGLFMVASLAATPTGVTNTVTVMSDGTNSIEVPTSVFTSQGGLVSRQLNSGIFTFNAGESWASPTNAPGTNPLANVKVKTSGLDSYFEEPVLEWVESSQQVWLHLVPKNSIRGIKNEHFEGSFTISVGDSLFGTQVVTVSGDIPAKDNALTGFITDQQAIFDRNYDKGNTFDYDGVTNNYIGYTHITTSSKVYELQIPVEADWFGYSGNITPELLANVTLVNPSGAPFTATLNKSTSEPYIEIRSNWNSPLTNTVSGFSFDLKGTFPNRGDVTQNVDQTLKIEVPIHIIEPSLDTHAINGFKFSAQSISTGGRTEFALGDSVGSVTLGSSQFSYGTTTSSIDENMNRLTATVSNNSTCFAASLSKSGSSGIVVSARVTDPGTTTGKEAVIGSGRTGTIALSVGSTSSAGITIPSISIYDPSNPALLSARSNPAASAISLKANSTINVGQTFTITLTPANFNWQGGSEPQSFQTKHLTEIFNGFGLIVLPEDYFDKSFTADISGNNIVVTIKAIKEMNKQSVKIHLGGLSSSATEIAGVTINTITTTNNRITGISSGVKLGTSPASGIEIVDVNETISATGLDVRPGSVMYISLNSDFFAWEKGQPAPSVDVTMNMINNAKSKIGVNCSSKSVISSIELVNVDGKAVIKIKFTPTLTPITAEKSFSTTVFLTVGGSRQTASEVTLSGTLRYQEEEVYDDYVDMSKTPVILPREKISNAELYLGELDLAEGDYVEATIYTSLSSNKRVFAQLREGTTSEHDKIKESYSAVQNVIHVDYSGLSESSSKIEFSGLGTLYVYDKDGNYLGTTNDKLELRSLYYMANMRINMSIGPSVSESSTAPPASAPPPSSSVPASSTSGNYNPATGTGTRNLLGVACAMIACATLGCGSLKLIRKRK